MHPHKDDEILTYLRSGSVRHNDSEGMENVVSSRRMMLMNAGKRFQHEEFVLEQTGILKGLQIFIRPHSDSLAHIVQFHDLETTYSLNQWRKLAGQTDDYPLIIRSATWILDMRLNAKKAASLPKMPSNDLTILLYVLNGRLNLDSEIYLNSGESAIIERETPCLTAEKTSDIVLFITDTAAAFFAKGMYSGNQKRTLNEKGSI